MGKREQRTRIRLLVVALLAAAALAAGALVAVGVAAGTGGAESSGGARSVRFAAAGDFGAGERARKVLAAMADVDPDFALALGDFSYEGRGSEQAWCDLVKSELGEDFPFELVAGNHESEGDEAFIDEFAECLPNRLPGLVGTYGREYYVDVPQEDPLVRVVQISPGIEFPDGVWRYDEGTERYDWTRTAIQDARDSGIPWVVVAMHKACITIGQHGCDVGDDLVNLLLDHRVDLVLMAHEHHYQRTAQLTTGSRCPRLEPGRYVSGCVVDDDDALERGAGTVLVTVGTGGVGLGPLNHGDPEDPYIVAAQGKDENTTYGALEVRLTERTLSARFVRVHDGDFEDEFRIG